jgi:hypothetical protein
VLNFSLVTSGDTANVKIVSKDLISTMCALNWGKANRDVGGCVVAKISIKKKKKKIVWGYYATGWEKKWISTTNFTRNTFLLYRGI